MGAPLWALTDDPAPAPVETPEETPAPEEPVEEEPVEVVAPAEPATLLRAERVHVRPGEVLENAEVLIRGGFIVAVGQGLEVDEDTIIVEGKEVCAGFIDPWSTLGIDSASASDLGTEASTATAKAASPFGEKYARQWAREAGVLMTRTQVGQNAFVGGLGAILRPSASAEHLVVLDDANLNVTCGVSRGGRGDVFDRVMEADRIGSMISGGLSYREAQVEYAYELKEWEAAIAEKEAELEKDFKKAKKDREKEIEKAEEKDKEFKEERYKEDKRPRTPRYDADSEVFARVAHGELPLVVEAHGAAELRALLAATEGFGRLRLVISGATGAAPFAKQLAERDIAVLLQPLAPGARANGERSGFDNSLFGTLAEAGVEVLIGTGGDRAADLPILAHLAIAGGLEREAAFEALTLGAARTFDLADRFGSVEVGKVAELLVLDGAPLQGRPTHVFTAGEVVEL
ncbi:MAG: amidohydrolase family protein [Planctomycetota bacterium]|nr:amidohydrolase family protein [Planctomycetota bacterium]